MKFFFLSLLFLVLVSCRRAAAPRLTAPADALAADAPAANRASIYVLPGAWTDQDGRAVSLTDLSGKVQVAAMIFTDCGYVCPRIVANMKMIADSLPAPLRDSVGFLLVSFDAERDTAAQLKRYALQQGLDNNWELLHGLPDQVRALSMLLNIRYQALPGGNFSHTYAIFILDKNGAILHSFEGLDPQTGEAEAVIRGAFGR